MSLLLKCFHIKLCFSFPPLLQMQIKIYSNLLCFCQRADRGFSLNFHGLGVVILCLEFCLISILFSDVKKGAPGISYANFPMFKTYNTKIKKELASCQLKRLRELSDVAPQAKPHSICLGP